MKLKYLLAGITSCIAAFGLSGTASAAAVIKTDIVMIVDESGSMGNVQANLRNNIGSFASILSAGGIDAQYGLVGYGNSAVVPRMLTNLTDPSSFATAAQGLQLNGGTEPAYLATAFALNALDGQASLFNFRNDAVKNIIIFTDEPSNGDTFLLGGLPRFGAVDGSVVTLAVADGLLTDANALFNAVLRGASTIASIRPLADNHGGNVYSLADLGSSDPTVVQNFVTDFATSKLQEIRDFCDLNPNDPACQGSGGGTVSSPGTLALFGLGLFGLAAFRRRVMV